MKKLDNKSEISSIPGSALGPDWHRDYHLKGRLEKNKKNVKIHYESHVVKIISKEEHGTIRKTYNIVAEDA